MNVLLETVSFEERGRILGSVASPRPLAWITSRCPNGAINISAFNSYTGLANDPPLVGISFSERKGEPKDTFANIAGSGEFVLNVVTRGLAESMNESARECGRGTDDFARLGLEPAEIAGVTVPRIAASPAALACVVEGIVPLEPSKCRLVVGRVVGAFLADGYDPVASALLASIAPLEYATLSDPFHLPKTWG